MNRFIKSNYLWVDWITVFDSWKKWPVLWISACTHWWEIVWLKVIDYFVNKFDIKTNLIKWKIIFIVSNIEAYKKYLKLKKKLKWEKLLIESRYIDENLNRCCSVNNLINPVSYERKRAKELEKILKKLDIIIDIHSTTRKSKSILLIKKKNYDKMKNIFNTDEVYINLVETAIWKPLIDITSRWWWIAIWMETWCQSDKQWYKIWIDNVYRLLVYLGMIGHVNKNILLREKNKKIFFVNWSIIVRNDKFKEDRKFWNLNLVKKWSKIAFDWINDIYAKEDTYIIMPALHKPWEEYCFLSKK